MKDIIRQKMIQLRNQMNQEEKIISDEVILKKIESDINFINAKVVAIFYAFKNEIDLSKLNLDGKTVLYPKISNGHMNFIIYNNKTKFEKNKFGIMEPVEGLIKNDAIDYMITPLLAYNNKYYRIGYGGGYYDKFIHLYKPKYKIGVAYSFQKIEFEEDYFDMPLDNIFTDEVEL